MAIVNWGVLGASNFARKEMAPAIHAAKGARLYGVASRSGTADGFAPYQPNLKIYQGYDALLDDPDIHAVYIPLPNTLHIEWCLKALEAGKHVLCEKPIAMRAADIDPVIALRDETGLLAAEAYMIVHHPQWHRAKHLLADGAIGGLIHVEGHFSYNNAAEPGNIRNLAEMGGGGIPDIGVYPYGATRWATGKEPVEITHADVDFENGVDIRARVSARFDGFTAHFVNSMRMPKFQEMRFFGEDGIITLTQPFGYTRSEVSVQQANGRHFVENFTGHNHYVRQVEAFGTALSNPMSFPWTLEDAKGTQSMIDMVFEKARC